jgi:AcrR family transcriptional regulator
MAHEGDSVNMNAEDQAKAPYHHGSLRESLIDAGMQLTRGFGPSDLGLRATSRLAGVSHNAAYRHFADHDALLSAVGDRCMQQLAAHMRRRLQEVTSTDPVEAAWESLNAIGTAYVEFALNETGWFRAAFTPHHTAEAKLLPSTADAPIPAENMGPFDLLNTSLDELVRVGAIPAERRPGLELAAWSAVHGLSTLLTDGPLRPLPREAIPNTLRVVLDVIASGLPQTRPVPIHARPEFDICRVQQARGPSRASHEDG